MGKYYANEDSTPPEIFIQYCIANELAEANRLKRIEIDLELIKEIDPQQISTFNYVNEDKA